MQEDAARAAGMSGFLTKPFDVDVAINLILKSTHKTGSITASYSPSPKRVRTSYYFPGLAVEHGLKTWKDEDAYRRYLRKFAHDFEHSVTEMAEAEPEVAAARAHALKGAAGNLALFELAALTACLPACKPRWTSRWILYGVMRLSRSGLGANSTRPIAARMA